jgi:NAD(P)H-dependent FMN reductase
MAKIVILSASVSPTSRSRTGARYCEQKLQELGCETDFIDLAEVPLPPYPQGAEDKTLQSACDRFNAGEGLLVATPTYNFGASGTLLTFLHYALGSDAGKRWRPFCVLASMSGLRSALAVDYVTRTLIMERQSVAVGPPLVGIGDASMNAVTGELSADMRNRVDSQLRALVHYTEAWRNFPQD